MKSIAWLINLAKRSPLLFSIALVLIGITSLALVVKYEEKRRTNCEDSLAMAQVDYNIRMDSMRNYYNLREAVLNQELKATLNSIIDSYKAQLKEAQSLSKDFNRVLKTTKN